MSRPRNPALEPVETRSPVVELVETPPPVDNRSSRSPTAGTMALMPFMYILECSDSSFYVGSTWDIERRLSEHANGEGAAYTRHRRPVRLVYVEEHYRITDAFAREKQVQGWGRGKRIALIEGRFADLPGLSRSSDDVGSADTGSGV